MEPLLRRPRFACLFFPGLTAPRNNGRRVSRTEEGRNRIGHGCQFPLNACFGFGLPKVVELQAALLAHVSGRAKPALHQGDEFATPGIDSIRLREPHDVLSRTLGTARMPAADKRRRRHELGDKPVQSSALKLALVAPEFLGEGKLLAQRTMRTT